MGRDGEDVQQPRLVQFEQGNFLSHFNFNLRLLTQECVIRYI